MAHPFNMELLSFRFITFLRTENSVFASDYKKLPDSQSSRAVMTDGVLPGARRGVSVDASLPRPSLTGDAARDEFICVLRAPARPLSL